MTLHLREISGGYGDTIIHRNLNLDIHAGEVLAVVGRNGTGKSTLARLISGDLPLSAGDIWLGERRIALMSAWDRARVGIVTMPQENMVFSNLSVHENIALSNGWDSDVAALKARFPRLAERGRQTAGSMSGGERKILGFARAMLMRSNVVILDEPSEGVQPENIRHMCALVETRRSEGVAFLLLEQNISMVVALADRVAAIESGGIGFEITEKEQITRERLTIALVV